MLFRSPAITRLLNKNVHREWRDSFEEYRLQEQEKVIEKDIHPTEGPLLMGELSKREIFRNGWKLPLFQ